MTRADLARKVAEDSQSTKRASEEWTRVVLDSLADAVEKEGLVELRNFGIFQHVVRKPKVGRNSSTGERIDIPAQTVIKFIPCQRLKDAVRHEHEQ